MIRAAVAAPMLQWMQQNNRTLDTYPMPEQLAVLLTGDPLQSVPLHSFADWFRGMCRSEGPDLPVRIVQDVGDVYQTMMGPFALQVRTAYEALVLSSRSLPYFSSHEHLVVERFEQGGVVRQFWGATFDNESLHYLHQFVAAVIHQLFIEVPTRKFGISSIELAPHPELGLDFLRGRFKPILQPHPKVISVHVTGSAFDVALRPRSGAPIDPPTIPSMESLRSSDGLSGAARIVLRGLLESGTARVDQTAAFMGLSTRSLQRQLKAEGTSFSNLLAEVRREAAADWLKLDAGTLRELATALGYAQQSSLTRALHRWEGANPSELAAKAAQDRDTGD